MVEQQAASGTENTAREKILTHNGLLWEKSESCQVKDTYRRGGHKQLWGHASAMYIFHTCFFLMQFLKRIFILFWGLIVCEDYKADTLAQHSQSGGWEVNREKRSPCRGWEQPTSPHGSLKHNPPPSLQNLLHWQKSLLICFRYRYMHSLEHVSKSHSRLLFY